MGFEEVFFPATLPVDTLCSGMMFGLVEAEDAEDLNWFYFFCRLRLGVVDPWLCRDILRSGGFLSASLPPNAAN